MAHRLIHPLLIGVALLLAVLAVLVTAGRIMVERVDRFEAEIVRSLERSLGGRVELEGLEGGWSILSPVVRVEHARVLAPNSGEAVLEIDNLVFELDIVESIGRWTVLASSMVVDRVEASIVQSDEGTWHLEGLPARRAGRSATPIIDFLVHSDQVIVRDGRVRIDAKTVELPPMVHGELMLENGLLAHRGIARVSWPGWERRTAGSVEARFDVSAIDSSIDWVSGDIWVSLDGIDRLHLPLEGPDVELDISMGSSALWLTLDRGELVDIATSAEVPRLLVISGERRIVLDDVLLSARLRADGHDVYQGRLDFLTFRLGNAEYSLEELSLRWDRDALEILLELPRLDLGSTRDLLLASGLLDEATARMVRGTALDGVLDDVKAQLTFDDERGIGLAFRASAQDIHTLDYRGTPEIKGLDGELLLFESGGRLAVGAGPFDVDFPDTFFSGWHVDQAHGDLYLQFRDQTLGLASENLVLETELGRISGSFGLYRPVDPFEQTLTVLATVEHADLARINDYLPVELDPALITWLNEGLKKGRMPWGAVVYQGHVKRLPDRKMHQLEVVAQVEDTVLRYHPDWPAAEDISALLLISGDWAKAGVSHASMGDSVLRHALVSVPRSGTDLHFRGTARSDGAEALHFLRTTPIAEMVRFVGPDWRIEGPLEIDFDIRMPLKEPGEPEVMLDVLAKGVSVDVPELRVRISDISGQLHYRHPMDISGEDVVARFLDGEVIADIASDVDPTFGLLMGMEFQVRGELPVEKVGEWLDQPMLDVMRGRLAFEGALRFDLSDGERATLELHSDLLGVEVNMPAPLGKRAGERRPLHFTLELGGDTEHLELIYGPDVRSRFMLEDGRVLSGTVGISGPMPTSKDGALKIAGSVHTLSVEDWFVFFQGREDAGRLPDITVDELQVDRLTYGDFHFDDVNLILGHAGDLTWVELINPQIEGSIAFPAGDALPYVNLDFLHLSGSGPVGDDPWAGWNPTDLPEFECNINEISIDGLPWGSWAFRLNQIPGGVSIQDLKAQLRGVTIAGVPRDGGPDDPGAQVIWRLTPEGSATEFEGRLEGEDLGDILQAFDYAPSVESKSVWADASIYWDGSPAAFSLVRLGGAMHVNVRNGRIVEVDTGTTALRVMGIFDFASIARRARFDFSDVFGKGLAFNRIQGELNFDEGRVILESPLEIKGPGSSIRVVGTVDLETGALDNQMIVTLPVGRTLPWYAAYAVLAANPLAGAGVIVAQRILKNQLEQLASAKYTVTGTLEEPEVSFVEMFNTEMDAPNEARGGGSSEGAVGEGIESSPARAGESSVSGEAHDTNDDTEAIE